MSNGNSQDERWLPSDRGPGREPERENDPLDRALDAALAKYSAVEPRAGLQGRVLANLQAQSGNARAAAWRYWAVAGAMAVLILIVAVFLSQRTRKPELVKVPSHITQQDIEPAQTANSADQPRIPQGHVPSVNTAAMRRAHHSRHSPVLAKAAPHLPEFPSLEPLSDQEKMLADYVAQFQQQAVLIARFNEEDLQRDRMEFFENAPGNTNDAGFETKENAVREE